jgi:hypothetical protein
MQEIKCEVKECVNRALMLYGNKWICGECYMRIINKQNEKKNREVEELELGA